LHANSVLAEEVLDYFVLFAEIADAYFERGLYAEAKPIYELLGGDPAVQIIPFSRLTFADQPFFRQTSSICILLQTAACMRNVDELRDAAEVYEHGTSATFSVPLR
jgi:general transcription factor 3C polypeptide 3 (transcription factor C subunit 4)